MKKLLILLFSLFFLSSPSVFAEDISDFQIEGMSIGDSLLDYMTEDEILEEIELNKDMYSHLKDPHKYAEVFLFKDFPTYDDGLSFYVINNLSDLYIADTNEKYILPAISESTLKNNSTNQYVGNKNKKFIILFIRGLITYNEDFDGCIQKRDEIADVLSKMFPNTDKWENVFALNADPSGDSKGDAITFRFASGGEISATCFDMEESFRMKKNYTEGLSVAIASTEILSWHGVDRDDKK